MLLYETIQDESTSFFPMHVACYIFPWKIQYWKWCSVYVALNQLKLTLTLVHYEKILHVVVANIVLASPRAILVQYLCYSYSMVARDLWSITTRVRGRSPRVRVRL